MAARLSTRDKSFPPSASGRSVSEYLSNGPRLTDLWTPAVVLDHGVLESNISFMAQWVGERGLELMPHGKTTMAPQLWRRQLEAGATGLTVATPWQLRVARDTGISAVMLANQLVDPAAIRWLAEDIQRSGGQVWSWIDHPDAIEIAEQALGPAPSTPLSVLLELGRPGGRTGARTLEDALDLGRRVAASPALRLTGVAGYEGSIASGRSPAAIDEVRRYVDELVALHEWLGSLYEVDMPLLTAGGSVYPDVVGESLSRATLGSAARGVLRSGAYVVHDHGIYRDLSPFDGAGLRPAARGIARVLSQPEPGLVLVDAGKRDFPSDEGLPVPLHAVGSAGVRIALPDAVTDKLNDQHAFVRVSPGEEPPVGSLVVFGLSHPCTIFDKWRRIPVVSDVDDPINARVVDVIDTLF